MVPEHNHDTVIKNLKVPNSISSFRIVVETLSKRFNREWVFKNLNYTFTSGTRYALTGPNGSGKSTLLQILWGQVPQTAGTISYQKGGEKISSEEVYRYISIATPYMDVIDEFTLLEQLQFHFRIRKIRNGQSIDDVIEAMYLEQARNKFIGNFSSGMKQRLKLALAFYTEADVLFLDEPGTNLDSRAFTWYKSQLEALPPDLLILIASNQPTEYPDNALKIDMTQFK